MSKILSWQSEFSDEVSAFSDVVYDVKPLSWLSEVSDAVYDVRNSVLAAS